MKIMQFLLLLLSFTFVVGYSKTEQEIANLNNKPTDRYKGIYLDQSCCLRLKKMISWHQTLELGLISPILQNQAVRYC